MQSLVPYYSSLAQDPYCTSFSSFNDSNIFSPGNFRKGNLNQIILTKFLDGPGGDKWGQMGSSGGRVGDTNGVNGDKWRQMDINGIAHLCPFVVKINLVKIAFSD